MGFVHRPPSHGIRKPEPNMERHPRGQDNPELNLWDECVIRIQEGVDWVLGKDVKVDLDLTKGQAKDQ